MIGDAPTDETSDDVASPADEAPVKDVAPAPWTQSFGYPIPITHVVIA